MTDPAWPEGTPATTGAVPVLARIAHDRAHLSRALPDPTGGRPVRVLLVDPRGTVPVAEGPDGPHLLWHEQPALPAAAVYLGEADGVPYAASAASAAHRARPGVDAWAVCARSAPISVTWTPGCSSRPSASWSGTTGTGSARSPARRRPSSGPAGQRDPTTGAEFFRTDPAVIMLVHDGGDRVVLGRQAVGRPAGSRSWPGSSSRESRPRRPSSGRSPRRSGCHRRPVRRQPALALPAVADAGFRRPHRGRRHPAAGPLRDRGGPLVHPRAAADRLRAAGAAAAGLHRPPHPRPLDRRRASADRGQRTNRPCRTRAGRSAWSARTTASAMPAGSTSSS